MYFSPASDFLIANSDKLKKYDVFRKKQYTRVFIGRRKRFLLISEDKRLCWDKL